MKIVPATPRRCIMYDDEYIDWDEWIKIVNGDSDLNGD